MRNNRWGVAFSELLVLTAWAAVFGGPHFPNAMATETVRLSPIVVTADAGNDGPETGDVDLDRTPAFYQKILRSEFEGKIQDLADVIEKQAGVQVRQSGGLGGFSSVSLRGSSSEQVLVYLDGVLLNDGAGGGVDLSHVSLGDVAAIEIFRGVSPLQFDQASIGGVVNIRTLRAGPGLTASASAGCGSFNTRQMNGFINHRPGKWDYLISGDYLASDNDFRFENDNGTPKNPRDDRWENRHNNAMAQFNLLARAGLAVDDDRRLECIHKFFSKDQGLPSWNNSPLTETDLSTDQNITTLKWTADHVSPLHLNTSSQIDYLCRTETYDDAEGHVGLGNQKNKYDTQRWSARTFFEYPGEIQLLQGSLGAGRETYTADDLLNDRRTHESRRFSLTAGLQDSFFWMDRRLQVTPGLRFQHVRDELEKALDDDGAAVKPSDLTENYLMPQLGARFQLNSVLTLKANIAKYDRMPSFYERFGDRGIFLGNPDLESEKGVNMDAGVEIFAPADLPMLRSCSGHAAVFASRIDDLITRTYDARGIGKSDNISEAAVFGAEGHLTLELNRHVSLTGQYTWQDTENKSPVEAFDGNALPGRFRHSWLAEARFTRGDLSLGVTYIREDDMFYDTANLLPAKTKSEINLSLAWAWKALVLTLEARNIGNDNYEDFNGYPQPGRSYFCSMKFSL